MIRCKTCCMPDTRPDVPFTDGECQACINYRNRPLIDWDSRKAELVKLLDRFDGRVIVPSSGGKDSTYQVLTLMEMGADVTVVTASTCMLTVVGRKNIDNLARYAKTIEVTPNRTVRRKLNRLGFNLVSDASWPQHASIWAIPFQTAVDLNIPLVIWGENSQDQYGGPIGYESAKQMTRRWVAELGGLNGLRANDFVGMEGITERDMRPYSLPADSEIERVGVEAHFLGAYIPWDSHRNASVAIAAGMQTMLPCPANWWDFENLDCMVTALHDIGMWRKFGYGRGCSQISVDVRAGRVSREDAMAWVRDHDGIFPDTYMGESIWSVLDYLEIKRGDFYRTLDAFTDWQIFRRVVDDESAEPMLIV